MTALREAFDWGDAVETCLKGSKKGSVWLIKDGYSGDEEALFFAGKRYAPISGKSCESCGKELDDNDAHYAYHLTKRIFCSQSCGQALNVLVTVTNSES